MYLNRRPNTQSVRAALLAAVILSTALIAPISTHAQTSTFSGPACTATPSPETDTWPVAGTDALVSVSGVPVTFTAATLLANDSLGTAPLSVSAVGPTSTNGGTITGSGPYTYTAAPGYSGTDYFTYILADASTPARTTAGIVHVSVGRDLTPPTVSITAPANGATISSNVVVRASAADNVAVAGVSFFDGTTPIGAAVTAAPYQVTWDITSVADGAHTLTAVARDVNGNSATSAAVNVSVTHTPPPPPPTATPTVDKMVFSEGASTAGRRTTAAFSTTTAGDVLVAFAASDGPAAGNAQSLTVSGAGLTWTRAQRAATKFGTSEIWTATASSVLTNVTVSSVQSSPNFHQSLTVIAFSGVAGVGASNAGGGVGATSVSLIAQAAGSVVYGVGNDWDRAAARSIPAGQTKVHEFVDTAVGDTFWVQALSGTTSAAGATVALSTSAPINDQWNFAAVELKPAAASTPPVMVTVPNVVGQMQATAQSTIAAAGLTVTVSSVANAAAAGTVIGQNPTGGTSAVSGSPVALTVSSGPAPAGAGPTVDATSFSEGTGNRTTPAFSTSGPAVLVAFATSDGNPTANGQTLTVSGAGLSWTRVQRAASQMGDAEIWTASSASALTNVTVTSTQSVTSVGGAPVNQLLYVVAFTGASGVGASNVAGAPTGAPSISLVSQAAGSVVYAVGNDYDQGVPRTVPASQTKVHEFVAPTGDTFWVQSLNAATSGAGASATINDTAPTTDQWNYAIVEIKR